MTDDLQLRRSRALSNPLFFGITYLAPFDPNWVAAPAFAADMLRFAISAERGVIMLPPEFLKTTLLSQWLPLWWTLRAAYFGDQLRGMLMSEEEGMAAANLAVLAWHIINNEDLARDFTDSRGAPLLRPSSNENVWREDAIVIERPHPSRDPTWQAKGLDSKGVHGRRLDKFVGDDLITPRNAGSPAMRKNALNVFELQVETRFVAGAQALLCGNFNDTNDLLCTVAKRPRWKEFRRPSLHLPGRPDLAPKESQFNQAVPLWPENWSRERLMVEYRDKPNRFRRIHLLDPRAEHGEKLNTGWAVLIEPDETPTEAAAYYIGVDPAPGGETHDLDYFNITVGASSRFHLDVVLSLDVRASTPDQVDLLGTVHDTFNRMGRGVQKIGGSKGAMDAYFAGAVEVGRPDLKRKLEPVSTPGSKSDRLEGLGPYARSGWLRFHTGTWTTRTSAPTDQAEELTLEEQWREFPHGAHDDKLDGLDIVIRVARADKVLGDRTHKVQVMAAD